VRRLLYPKGRTAIFLLLGFFCEVRPSSWGQNVPPVIQSWTYNFPSASLQIEPVGDRSFDLENHSQTRVVRYRLGCAAIVRDRETVITQFAQEPTDIAPGDSAAWISTHSLPPKVECLGRKAKLTIVSIEFADGGVWVAPGVDSLPQNHN
jgi:hypothetical protein